MIWSRKIAEAHATIVETEDSNKANNPWSQADFAKKAPGLDWNAFFEGAQLATVPTFVAWHPERRRNLAALVEFRAARRVEGLARPSTRSSSRPVLPTQMHKDDFAFFGTDFDRRAAGARAGQAAASQSQLADGRCGRPAICRQIFPARAKSRHRQDGIGDQIGFDKRIDALPGWRRRPGGSQGQAYLDEGRHRLSRQVARLFIARMRPDDAYGNDHRAHSTNIVASWRSSASRRTATNCGWCRRW